MTFFEQMIEKNWFFTFNCLCEFRHYLDEVLFQDKDSKDHLYQKTPFLKELREHKENTAYAPYESIAFTMIKTYNIDIYDLKVMVLSEKPDFDGNYHELIEVTASLILDHLINEFSKNLYDCFTYFGIIEYYKEFEKNSPIMCSPVAP